MLQEFNVEPEEKEKFIKQIGISDPAPISKLGNDAKFINTMGTWCITSLVTKDTNVGVILRINDRLLKLKSHFDNEMSEGSPQILQKSLLKYI